MRVALHVTSAEIHSWRAWGQ